MNRPNSTEVNSARRVLDHTIELARIPAPTNEEGDRALMVSNWWSALGLRPEMDDVGNVLVRLSHAASEEPAILICAHLDTVFGRDTEHEVRFDGDNLVGPSVGDNSVAVAALVELPSILPSSLGRPVWLVATVGEEGLGNLRGVSSLLGRWGEQVGSVIALEGNYLGRVNRLGIGSERIRVTVVGPGGHSWEEAHHPSAVEEACRMICLTRQHFDSLLPGFQGRVTLNVGRIEGGASVNARATDCAFLVEVRAEEPEDLASATGALRALFTTRIQGLQEIGRAHV